MLSLPDMAILGGLALLIFGEERLPRIVRQAGRAMREVQIASQSFVREMERAADVGDLPPPQPAVAEEAPPPREGGDAPSEPETSI